MSNSVVFLLIAVGLSVVGSVAVWLHGRPRRSRSSVDQFHAGLRALSSSDRRHEPLSGVTIRRHDALDDDGIVDVRDDDAVAHEPSATSMRAGASRRSPRPTPRSNPRPPRAARGGDDPGA